MKLAGRSHIGRKRNVYRSLVGKPQENRSFKTIRKWEINTEMDCKYIGCKAADWIHLA